MPRDPRRRWWKRTAIGWMLLFLAPGCHLHGKSATPPTGGQEEVTRVPGESPYDAGFREYKLWLKHPDAPSFISSIASLCKAQVGKGILDNLATHWRTAGPKHRWVAHSINELAMLCLRAGDVAGATRLMARAAEIADGNTAVLLRTKEDAQKRQLVYDLKRQLMEELQWDTYRAVSLHI